MSVKLVLQSRIVIYLWPKRIFLLSPRASSLAPSFPIVFRQTDRQTDIIFGAAISNSFGFGGHNSVVAFSGFKP